MSDGANERERLIALADDLDLANEMRRRLMFNLSVKSCVYVMFDNARIEDGYEVKLSTQWGSYPGDDIYNEAISLVQDLVSGSTDATIA